jgi:hypothetical protein
MSIDEFLTKLTQVSPKYKWRVVHGQLRGYNKQIMYCPIAAVTKNIEHNSFPIAKGAKQLGLSIDDGLQIVYAADDSRYLLREKLLEAVGL